MKMRMALAQIQILPGDFQHNLNSASRFMQNAADNHTDMILLPELWSSGYDLEQAAHWSAANAALLPDLANLAQRHHLWIGGSLLEEDHGRIYNTFSLFDPQGNKHASYRKIHLFGLMKEDRILHPGSQPTFTSLPWADCGLAICYDLRFPELFRQYTLQGAQLFLIPAEWPLSRAKHWSTLLCARAIENQCFVAAVNSVAAGGETIFGGQSMLIDPSGNILSQASSGEEELVIADLDFDLVEQVRKTIPVFKDRRPDIYG